MPKKRKKLDRKKTPNIELIALNAKTFIEENPFYREMYRDEHLNEFIKNSGKYRKKGSYLSR